MVKALMTLSHYVNMPIRKDIFSRRSMCAHMKLTILDYRHTAQAAGIMMRERRTIQTDYDVLHLPLASS